MNVEKLGYKRVETDDEFRERVHAKHTWWNPTWMSSTELDLSAWGNFKMQRRIIEVFP